MHVASLNQPPTHPEFTKPLVKPNFTATAAKRNKTYSFRLRYPLYQHCI